MGHPPLKIAMLGLRSIGGECSGGVERHVEELALRMAAQGHALTVFCRGKYNPGGNRTWQGIRLRNTPAIYSKHLEAITHTAGLMPFVLAGFDIVHIHATGPSLFSWLPRLFGRATVVTVHGLDFMRAKWGGAASMVLRAGAWTAVHCPHETIVVSQTLRTHYQNTANRPTHWIPNGVTKPVQHPISRLARFGLEEKSYILSLGRLVPEKGIHYLIKAFTSLSSEFPELCLVIAGSGGGANDPYEQSLHALAGGDPRIIFTGPLYGQDKDEAFSNAQLFVLPSDLEGMPIAMLEAMSYACPVLSSNIPECAELWENAPSHATKPLCASFAAANTQDLALAIAKLLATPQSTRAMGSHGQSHVLSAYNWDTLTEDTLAVYAKALHRKTE